MGEVKSNECTVVAILYQFSAITLENGDVTLNYKAEGPRALPVDIPPVDNDANELESEDTVFDEDDVEFLRSLDPKEWKDQDHYAVLGLKTLRHLATDEDIKRAYRRKVLKHHPDKRKAQGEEIRPDDDYFTCITKAYEILGEKRRSYDSVDPEFDDTIPTERDLKGDFFKTFSSLFQLNARWSEKKNVPLLGDASSTREYVEHFYSFWYNFESWREFSYLDEEEKEKGQDRDERRWIEKQNKVARAKRKKEEMSRIRSLVDLAYNADPRIAKFKQEEKDRKLAAKRAKQDAAQARKDEEERILREAKMAKEKAEEAERQRIEMKRLEREAQKKALKKEKRVFRDFCKTSNYFAENEAETLAHMAEMEKICEAFTLEELENLNKDIKSNGRNIFIEAFKNMNNRIEAEKMASLQANSTKEMNGFKTTNSKKESTWLPEDLALLIKAVNLFPAGTSQRWEVVANFINQHTSSGSQFNAKEVLAKAKDLQNTDFSRSNLKVAANRQAFSNFEKEKKNVKIIDEVTITEKVDEKGDNPWTTTEQQLLEQALKTYPASTAERWDRIAECVPNRSKKDCMRRYKELVETIKAKKAAQASVTAK